MQGVGATLHNGVAACCRLYCIWTVAAVIVALLISILFPTPAFAQDDDTVSIEVPAPESSNDALSNLSIEELLNVEVTSVSKKKERKQDAAAAVYVLTSEDIRRSGATNIPELLRTVPGLEVAKLTSSQWSVTSRGFGGRFANKLLVLIDGRSIYTPLYSGVYWEGQEVMLEDVDRVEVIRGPGGTLWGANAVNGVINIVTKSSADTQGLLISAGGGTEERGFVNSRWGGAIGDDAHYRLYVRGFIRDEGGDTDLLEADDGWSSVQGGFRTDWQLSPDDRLTVQGDIRDLNLEQVTTRAILEDPFVQTFNESADYESTNVLARWTHTFSDESELHLQAYYDAYNQQDPSFRERRDTVDLELQHRFRPSDRHEIVWGLGVRSTWDRTNGSIWVSLDPEDDNLQFYSVFLEDDITLTDKLHLIVGSKFEYNTYTQFEIQPSARIRWTPNERHTVWGAVSRAVRTPSRAERASQLLSAADATSQLVFGGDDDFKSEDLTAIELGYRVRATERLALDLALFYNMYNNVRSISPEDPIVTPEGTIVSFTGGNGTDANTYGLELAMDWAATDWWRVRAGYSYLEVQIDPATGDAISGALLDDTPEQQFFVQNSFNLPHHVEIDLTVRAVDALKGIDVPGYVELDARLAWKPTEDLELALVGQNLLNNSHEEFASSFISTANSAVQRGVYGKVTWTFQPGKNR